MNSSRHVDAIALLQADHRAVEALFAEYEKAPDRRSRHGVALAICKELVVHDKLESKLFYPAAKRAAFSATDEINEGIVEHDAIRLLAKEIPGLRSSDEFFEAKVKVLMAYVKHHVRQEETEMFMKIKGGKLDLQSLGSELQAAKQKYGIAYDERLPKRPSAGLFVGRSRTQSGQH